MSDLVKRIWKWLQRPFCSHDWFYHQEEISTGYYLGDYEQVDRLRTCTKCGFKEYVYFGWSKS